MTFATLEIIHRLLTAEMNRIEADLVKARRLLAEIRSEAGEKIREEDLRQRALMRDLSRIMAALEEFDGQDWH